MTVSASNKLRAIGGASVLALSASFGGVAFAQTAPLTSAPTPTPTPAPANVEECAVVSGVVTCAPGVDADGFFDISGADLGLDVQDGSVVQNSIIITGAVTGTVDGAIQTTGDFEGALFVGAGSDVTVNGYIQTDGNIASAVETEAGSTLTNNGTLYTTGGNSNGAALAADSTLNNNGLIQTDNNGSTGVLAFGAGVTVNNSATGIIVTSGTNSAGVESTEAITVNNDGLIQTFGPQAAGVTGGDASAVTNTGNIVTAGNLSDAVSVGAGSTVSNTGLIQTDGDDSIGVFGVGDDVTVTNGAGGSIVTNGDGGFGVSLLSGSVTNDGMIMTTGLAGFGIDVLGVGNVVSNGSISTTGEAGVGIIVGDGSTVENGGSLTTTGLDAVGIIAGDGSTVTLTDGSVIDTAGDNAGGVVILGAGTFSNAGSITTAGADAQGVTIVGDATVTNSGSVVAQQARAFDIGGVATFTNTATGVITSNGDDAIRFDSDGSTLVNDGSITSDDDEAVEASGLNDITVTNNGTITAGANGDKGIEAEENLTVINTGTITSITSEAIEADGAGLFLDNSGSIISPLDDAVDGDDNVEIINSGLIQGGENDGLELNSGTITNSGTIESLSSDPNGSLVIGGTVPELDAAIDFDAGTDGNEDGVVTNLAGGIIRGDIGINSSAGNQDSPDTNDGTQQVVNFGTVEGRMGDAALLGNGDDEWQQWTGASVVGNINLEAGDDTFILEGLASSVDGTIFGGMGTDAAIIAGTLDADNFDGFESYQIGSTLGGTLNDAVISGDRTLDGDVSVVGTVSLGLGVDTLTSTGAMTLEAGSTVTIETPLDFDLIGQTVLVLQEGTTFTDNGATINIIDDDLLIDYVPVFGSLSVQVVSDNPLLTSGDANVATFGGALQTAVTNGTLSQANFDVLNGLADNSLLEDVAINALPVLNEGAGREIFETSQSASQALNRHLAGDSSGVWGQVVVRGASQDAASLSQGGYDSDQLVFTIGGDVALGEMARVGVLASYADIENDDFFSGTTSGETEIESIKLGAYAAVSLGDRGFINGELAYLTGEIESTRTGLLGTVNSGYDFDGFAYSAVVGYDLLPNEDVSITPSIGFSGASISFDNAVEAGGFGFTVARDDTDFAELRGGIELAGQVSPRVSGFIGGTIVHDLSDDASNFTLTSAELGTFGVGIAPREQDRFELAAGASIAVSETFTIDVGYQGDFASGYDAHSGRASLRFAF